MRKIYREGVGQSEISYNKDQTNIHSKERHKNHKNDNDNNNNNNNNSNKQVTKSNQSPYNRYLQKRETEQYDKFKAMDLLYFFQDISKESGYRYSISNIIKETSCMKTLLGDFSPEDICNIIRFIFKSDQDYINKARCSPYLISSNWRNTLYPDSQAWLKGEYTSKNIKKTNPQIINREWGKPKNTSIKIGEWEE